MSNPSSFNPMFEFCQPLPTLSICRLFLWPLYWCSGELREPMLNYSQPSKMQAAILELFTQTLKPLSTMLGNRSSPEPECWVACSITHKWVIHLLPRFRPLFQSLWFSIWSFNASTESEEKGQKASLDQTATWEQACRLNCKILHSHTVSSQKAIC